MSSFYTCLKEGKTNEERIRRFLQDRGHEVVDVSAEPEYQKKDIDCLLRKDGRSTTLEIKLDRNLHCSGNFFFEDGRERKTGWCDGWLHYCEAEYICFFDDVSNCGYILDLKRAKAALEKAGRKRVFYDYGDDCNAYALLLPFDAAAANEVVVLYFNL